MISDPTEDRRSYTTPRDMTCAGIRYVQQGGTRPTTKLRDGHRQRPLKHVGDAAEAAIQDDVAGLRQRVVGQFRELRVRQAFSNKRTNQRSAFCLGKDQKSAPADVTLEALSDSDQTFCSLLVDDLTGCLLRQHLDGRDR